MKLRFMFVLAVLLVVPSSSALHATDYYVSSSTGSDSHDGLAGVVGGGHGPWQSLTRASQRTYAPGDNLYLKRGDIWTGQRLVLQGIGDVWKPDGQWITVAAYPITFPGDPNRPKITNPPADFTAGLVDFRQLRHYRDHPTEGYAAYGEPLPPTHDDSMKIAIALNQAAGWKIKNLEICDAESGIFQFTGPNYHGYWIEDCYFHDINGLTLPYAPWHMAGLDPFDPNGTDPDPAAQGHSVSWDIKDPGDPSYIAPSPGPAFGKTISLAGENVTIKDCVFAACSNFVTGQLVGGMIENCYMNTAEGIPMVFVGNRDFTIKNCTLMHGYTNQWTAWLGQGLLCVQQSVNCQVDTCEILGNPGWMPPYHGGDTVIMNIEGNSLNLAIRNCFFHDALGAAFEWSCGGAGNESDRGNTVENNLFYELGYYDLSTDPNVEMDCFWSDNVANWGEKRFNIWNNTIYKSQANPRLTYLWLVYKGFHDSLSIVATDPGCYCLGTARYPDPGWDNNRWMDYVPYDPKANPSFFRPGGPSPDPPGPNLAPSAAVIVSTGSDSAASVKDGSFTTEWASTELAPWVTYSWPAAQTVGTVRIFDRLDLTNWIQSGTIKLFGDDAETRLIQSIPVHGGILNSGMMREVTFPPVAGVKRLKFISTRCEGTANGLAELEVYAQGDTAPPPPDPDYDGELTVDFNNRAPATLLTGVYGLSSAGNNIDWGNADFCVGNAGETSNYLYINDYPITAVPPNLASSPKETTSRTFTLPKGSMLKRIRIKMPAAPAGAQWAGKEDPNFAVTFSQSGNPPHTLYGSSQTPEWREINLVTEGGWSLPNTTGNIVKVDISTWAYETKYSVAQDGSTTWTRTPADIAPRVGVDRFLFDDIVYGN